MRSRQCRRGPKAPDRWPGGSGSHEGPFLLSGLGRALSADTDQAGNAEIALPDRGGTVPNQNRHIWVGELCPPTFIPPSPDLPAPGLGQRAAGPPNGPEQDLLPDPPSRAAAARGRRTGRNWGSLGVGGERISWTEAAGQVKTTGARRERAGRGSAAGGKSGRALRAPASSRSDCPVRSRTPTWSPSSRAPRAPSGAVPAGSPARRSPRRGGLVSRQSAAGPAPMGAPCWPRPALGGPAFPCLPSSPGGGRGAVSSPGLLLRDPAGGSSSCRALPAPLPARPLAC